MVNQIPGFQLANGEASRGFGSPGNVLINRRRPAAKQASPADILRRMPVSRVARIELIRSGTGGVDMGGYPQLANIVLRDDAPAAVSWEFRLRHNMEHGGTTPEGSFALSSDWRGMEYTLAGSGRRFARGDRGVERVDDGAALRELRRDSADTRGEEVRANFGAVWWADDTRLALATGLRCENRDGLRSSDRTSANGDGHLLLFGENVEFCRAEIGMTTEKPFEGGLVLEAMAMVNYTDESELSTEEATQPSRGLMEYRVNEAMENRASEAIARAELTWNGITEHTVLSTLEFSGNRMRNHVVRIEEGSGDVVVSNVPGANGIVEELRANAFVGDVWTGGDLSVDLGVGAEVSRLTQQGDAKSERTFTFLKPAGGFTIVLDGRTRWRMRLEREVSQLDFGNFVSETNLEDGVIAPGNPDLHPEVHWLAEISLDRGFGSSGTLGIAGFHHWISDVEDQLPITATSTATGNIGDGRRWGIEIGTTLPLEILGFPDARLDLTGRWQDSSVTDPATGRERVLSDEREYDVTAEFRQDLRTANLAWGGRVRMLAARPFFRINEIDMQDEGEDVQLFVETTRFGNLKLNLTIEDAFNRGQTRERSVYTGERHLTRLLFHESRRRQGGRRISVAVSGAF